MLILPKRWANEEQMWIYYTCICMLVIMLSWFELTLKLFNFDLFFFHSRFTWYLQVKNLNWHLFYFFDFEYFKNTTNINCSVHYIFVREHFCVCFNFLNDCWQQKQSFMHDWYLIWFICNSTTKHTIFNDRINIVYIYICININQNI